jgi:small subunit ribosomal protein S3
MGQITNISNLHLLQNKNSNSFWYADYNFYAIVFEKDFLIYLYLRAQSRLQYNILKRKHLFDIEITKSCIYRTNKKIILNLELIYLKNKYFKTEHITQFSVNIYRYVKKIFNDKNTFFVFYKISFYNAKFLALRIATILEKRIKFRSKIVEKIIKTVPCLGVRVNCKGRLNFVDRARSDQIATGSVPLQVFEANIDYGIAVANTKKGLQSVKVWIFNC